MVADRPPDMISSVMSRPPWLGSRILICWGENIGRVTWTCLSNNNLQRAAPLLHVRSAVVVPEGSGLNQQMLSVQSPLKPSHSPFVGTVPVCAPSLVGLAAVLVVAGGAGLVAAAGRG